eukprot:scaffold7206_cov143-Skeletonema_marinoi.AAC.6
MVRVMSRIFIYLSHLDLKRHLEFDHMTAWLVLLTSMNVKYSNGRRQRQRQRQRQEAERVGSS